MQGFFLLPVCAEHLCSILHQLVASGWDASTHEGITASGRDARTLDGLVLCFGLVWWLFGSVDRRVTGPSGLVECSAAPWFCEIIG